MNRMVAFMLLDGSTSLGETLDACHFNTPHWAPDHQAVFAQGSLTLSATQRFITPQCHAALMPYRHEMTGCVINADVYLTHRESLCAQLGCDEGSADAHLLLLAYLKWGEQCTRHLVGQFSFMIWDPRHQHLFAAVDPFAHCPLFYAHQPRQWFMMANECSPFHTLPQPLTLNAARFIEFANDVYSATQTAYQEISKLPAGHQMVVTSHALRQTCYWRWKNHRQLLPQKTREQYYEGVQHLFERAVQMCLRRTGPLTTQLSGGLDSSAVTAQAALLLARQQDSLSAFTSIPNGLAGESYRSGWYYHELPRIETLLARYTNIQHAIYMEPPSTDIFETLKPLQRCFDQPLRNINNLGWTLACYKHVLAQKGRVLLIGAGGNGTISWAGGSITGTIKAALLLRWRGLLNNRHETMLSGSLTAPLRASVYALQLWYGVRRLDPTQDLDLTVFCLNVPQWVYRQGRQAVQQRLLTREGLSHLLPDAISKNPYRGEQGADWYLHYNLHRQRWRDRLLSLTPAAQEVLWQGYQREKMMGLFDQYPHLDRAPDRQITHDLCYQLLRCLSAGFYLV